MSDAETQPTTGNAPTHIAYYIREGTKKKFWNVIGAAWAHEDEDGLNIVLDCTPVNGKFTLRRAPAKE